VLPFLFLLFFCQLRNMAINMMVAGRDTTASLLTTVFMMLSRHPAVEEKLAAEVKSVCGDAVPTFEQLCKGAMPYADAVINECLRLWPPVPLEVRKSLAADVLPDGTHIPAGTEV
jgi:cytochrome P450